MPVSFCQGLVDRAICMSTRSEPILQSGIGSLLVPSKIHRASYFLPLPGYAAGIDPYLRAAAAVAAAAAGAAR